ncbi:MAG: sulfatase-like hydrolase/transferase [Pseudomonadota bacterium]
MGPARRRSEPLRTEARPGEPEPGRKKKAGRFWCDDLDCGEGLETPDGFYSTHAFTDKAIAFVEEASAREAPYLLYLSYTAPNDPLHAPAETVARFVGDYDKGWAPVAEARYKRQVALVDPQAPRRPHLWRSWASLSAAERENQTARMEIYAAMIAELDAGVRRLLDALEQQGTLDSTLIIFASDNGASAELVLENSEEIGAEYPVGSVGRWTSLGPDWAEVGNTPFRFYKNDSYEGGTSDPFLVRWPDGMEETGRTAFMLSHLLDIHPTLIDVASSESAPGLRGMSLLPLIRGESLPPRAQPLFNQWQDNRAVWDGNWKLVARDDGPWALYNIADDPHETEDLSDEHPEVAERLAAAYDSWFESVLPAEE